MRFYRILTLVFLLIIGNQAFTQDNKNILGQVVDVSNSEPLVGANVFWEGRATSGTITDLEGNFQIEGIDLPAKLIISHLGFEKSVREIHPKDLGKPVRFFLKPEALSLQEVLIQERKPDEQIRSLEMGKSSVPIETIKNIPALFGEVDLLRSLQLLPGVQTAGEGTTGLFVRGGSADQNLVQLD